MKLHRTFTPYRLTREHVGFFFKKFYYLLDTSMYPEGLKRGCNIKHFAGVHRYRYLCNDQQLTSWNIYEALQEI